MPELPEVETIVRTLAPQILGCHIKNAELLLPRILECAPYDWEILLMGATVQKVFRRGKLIMLELMPKASATKSTHFFTMAFHLKMTGRLCIHPENTKFLPHTRMAFHIECPNNTAQKNGSTNNSHYPKGNAHCFESGTGYSKSESSHFTNNTKWLFFDDVRTFGYCRIMQKNDLASWPFLQNLGIEPLEHTPKQLAKLISYSKGAIKGVLLNQKIIAGIGNIYADEALFASKIHPQAKVQNIPLPRLHNLADALQKVLLQSIKECGSSIKDYRDANGNAGAFQNNFYVYGRKNETCRVCQTPLQVAKVAGRTTIFCPDCQRCDE